MSNLRSEQESYQQRTQEPSIRRCSMSDPRRTEAKDGWLYLVLDTITVALLLFAAYLVLQLVL